MCFRTIFTSEDRHTYVDPDYAYTDEEAREIQKHKDMYKAFLDDLQEKRITQKRNKY